MASREEQSLAMRSRIKKENKKEYDNEKRVKELTRRGFNEGAISGMMEIPESHVRKMKKHRTTEMICDGKV